jgi:hypothetical protein
MKNVIGIDPANKQSAFCAFNGRMIQCELIDNQNFFNEVLRSFVNNNIDMVYIETIQAMGMPSGAAVFETCFYIGRLQLLCEQNKIPYEMVKRTEIKLHHCNTTRAKDTNIRQALIDRFGDKGTKKEPGFFFGISGNDQWSACAIALYGYDKLNGR